MSSKSISRLVVLLAVSLVLMYVGKHSPLSACFTMEYLTETISSSGGFGVLLFILAYAIGTLMNIPGVIFLFIAFMVYSGITGVVIGYSGTLIAMVVHFFFVRTMGGEALSEIKQPFIRKQMQKLTDNPIKTTVILRLVLFVSPPVNYALALSSIRFRDFLIGSMIALPGNIVFNYLLMVYAKDFILAQFA